MHEGMQSNAYQQLQAPERNMKHQTSTPVSDEDLLDAVQVSVQEFDGRVRPRTIESWRSPRRAQGLPFVVVGRRRLYRRGDVRQWKAQNTIAPALKV